MKASTQQKRQIIEYFISTLNLHYCDEFIDVYIPDIANLIPNGNGITFKRMLFLNTIKRKQQRRYKLHVVNLIGKPFEQKEFVANWDSLPSDIRKRLASLINSKLDECSPTGTFCKYISCKTVGETPYYRL